MVAKQKVIRLSDGVQISEESYQECLSADVTIDTDNTVLLLGANIYTTNYVVNGYILADITVTPVVTWSHTIDFTTDAHDFVRDTTEPQPSGTWSSSIGWIPDDETDGGSHRRYVFIRWTIGSTVNLTSATMLYDLTKGTFTADDVAFDIQTNAGDNSTNASGMTSGSSQTKGVSLTGGATFIALRLQSCYNRSPTFDGDCIIRALTLTGTGTEPTWP
jgi:hypothetical protein